MSESDAKRPGFMKLSVEKSMAHPPGEVPGEATPKGAPPPDFTDAEKAAAAKMAEQGGVFGWKDAKDARTAKGPTGAPEVGIAPDVDSVGEGTFDLDSIGSRTMVVHAPEPRPSAKGPEQTVEPKLLLDRAEEAAAVIRRALGKGGRIGVILGSGLGGFADALEGARFLEYTSIPHFPRSTVVGHRGRLGYGTCNGIPVWVMQGRFHYYEGYALDEVTFPVRVLARLGVKLLVVTNAAGGVGEHLAPGDLMSIDDHLNLMGANPLRGPHDDRLGARFPDMSAVYAERFRAALAAACPAGTSLKHGVYAALAGPSYETPAEIRMLRALGADAVGMSTVPEAIVASQMGIGVCGISGIANMAAGMVKGHTLTHAEVVECMNAIGGKFTALLQAALPGLDAAI